MGIANEIEFENDLCRYLADHGWLYSKNDVGYDRRLALFTDDALAWVKETQPDTWSKFEAASKGSSEAKFLERLAQVLASEGTLEVLRKGFKVVGVGASSFQMVQFKPAFGLNPDLAAKYAAVRLRVVRQLHYSLSNEKSIDLVLFVNGIPVATIELKTDFTQAVEDAKTQYRETRLHKDAITRADEIPLLTFKRGALKFTSPSRLRKSG